MKTSYLHRAFLTLLLLTICNPIQAQFNLEQLAKTLSEHTVKGKAGTNLILNRGITDGLSVQQNESTLAFAKALGFVDADGGVDPVCISLPLNTPDWLSQVKKLHEQGKLKATDVIDIGSPMDAIQIAIKAAKEKHQNEHASFRDFLKGQKANPEGLGLKSLDEAKLEFDAKGTALYYFSQRFIIEKALEQLKQYQAELVKLKPRLTLGGPYVGNFEQNTDGLMLEAWRSKVFTPWVAERSWQNGEFSPQVLGYYLAMGRAANSRNPLYCDLHVGNGNYPTAIRRSFYLSLAHGAKGIRFVGAIPPGIATGKESLPMIEIDTWKTLRELTHEAGLFAAPLATARPRAPDVGILVSLTQELWDPSPWVHEERKAIYHAARLSGHSVTFLTEDDIQDGKIQKLAAIYVVGSHLSRETGRVLKNWVSSGACLACVGGPFRDEYNQPLTDMLEIQGLTEASWQNIAPAGPAKITLAKVKPTDTIKYGYNGMNREFPVVYGKLKVTSDETQKNKHQIYGKFNDGSAAVIKHEYEPVKLGHCWVFCAPLGSSWLRTSLTGRKWEVGNQPKSYNHQILLQNLDGEAGDIVMAASGDARWDVITNNLAVETVLLESRTNIIMICINWSDKPEKAFLTAQFVPKGIEKAQSITLGQLATQRASVTLSLPKDYKVNVADVVIFE